MNKHIKSMYDMRKREAGREGKGGTEGETNTIQKN